LLPVGAGEPRQIDVPELAHVQNITAHFLPDGQRIAVIGNEANRPSRTYVVDLHGGRPRAVTPEGVYATMPSPDGRYLCGGDSSARLGLYPVEGGAPRMVQLPEPGLVASQWSADSKALYVYRAGEAPMKVYRMEIDSGKMTLVRELIPADSAGVVTISPVVTNYKGSQFAYSYYQTLSALYVISGLK
jgi:Tol biopolymer transport system component